MFAFRLALHLGFVHPDIMLEQMTGTQLSGWMAYAAVEPFGEYRAELRHGQQMQLMDAAHFKRDKPTRVADFMNFVDRPEEKQIDFTSEQEQARIDKEVFSL